MSARCQSSARVANRVVIAHTEEPRLQQVVTTFVFESQFKPGGHAIQRATQRATGRATNTKQRGHVFKLRLRWRPRYAFVKVVTEVHRAQVAARGLLSHALIGATRDVAETGCLVLDPGAAWGPRVNEAAVYRRG